MGISVQRGQSTGPNDLTIFVQKNGLPVTPFALTFSVYDYTTGSEVLFGAPNQAAVEEAPGHYYAPLLLPLSANIGDWVIKWFVQELPASPVVTQFLRFGVVAEDTQVSLNLSQNEEELLALIRVVLRDNNPDRNYHFAPPTREQTINQFTTRFGYLWEDEELLQHMKIATYWANMLPPTGSFPVNLAEYGPNDAFRFIPIIGGAASAVRAMALNWVEEEFGYSIGGISLDLSKAAQYIQMKDNLETEFKEAVQDYLKNGGASVIKGLSQPRYGVGFTTALGPAVREGVTSARAFVGRRR